MTRLVRFFAVLVLIFSFGGQLKAQPKISLLTTTLSFPLLAIGDSSKQFLKITNSGDATLNGTFRVTNSAFVLVDGFSFSVAAGATADIEVHFVPKMANDYIDTMIIRSNAAPPNDSMNVKLLGRAHLVDTSHGKITASSLDFKTIQAGSFDTISFDIISTGDATLTFSGNVGSLFLPFKVIKGAGNFSLHTGPNGTRNVKVVFMPDHAGEFHDTLHISTSDKTSPETADHYIPLSGTATPGSGVNSENTTVAATSVWPNPTRNESRIKLSLQEPESLSIVIRNVEGKQVIAIPEAMYPAGESIVEFDLASLPAGTYYCSIVSARGAQVLKISHLPE